MLASFERFDPRVGVWHALPDMHQARGYLTAAFTLAGTLCVAGGVGQSAEPLGDFEAFDTRAGKWRTHMPHMPQARSCAAVAHAA